MNEETAMAIIFLPLFIFVTILFLIWWMTWFEPMMHERSKYKALCQYYERKQRWNK